MNSNEIIENIELEIKKFIDICTIFKKLKEQGGINSVFNSIFQVFYAEHEFTTKELQKLASQNKDSFDFLEHYKLNSSIFKANFLLILQNMVEEIWSSFLRMELSNQKNDIKTKNPTKDSEKTPKIAYESEIEDYLSKTDFLKLRTPENIPETHPKNSKNNTNPHKNSNNHDNNDNPPSKNEGSNKKALEHSKSKEKIIQQAFFSNINNSYGSLTNQRTIVSRNMSNGGIKTPNMEKTPINNNNIGVSYNVNSVRSPKVNNVGQNQKIKETLKITNNNNSISNNPNNSHKYNPQFDPPKSSFNLIEKYLK